MSDFQDWARDVASKMERALADVLPAGTTPPQRLHAAMRYATLGGGKRVRPMLAFAAGALTDAPFDRLKIAGAAVEIIHAYSLIHDDLPCMDNDDLRRGRPTAHRQFDEATALLAGDALLTLAFQLLGRHYAHAPEIAAALLRELAGAAGSEQLIGGQMEDLLAEKKSGVTAGDLVFIHHRKTAAMIAAALAAGALCGGVDEGNLAALRDAGRHLGLAFQIVDDILDATADTATLGKTAGKDARAGKATFVSVHGLDAARAAAAEHTTTALAALRRLPGGAPFLVRLAEQMLTRKS